MTASLMQETSGRVQAGPFIGMALSAETSWGDGDILPKLLGSYEEELYPWLRDIFKIPYDVVIDVGCAEGYYVAGFARTFPPSTRIFGFDVSAEAQRICRINCEMNNVGQRVTIGGWCDAQDLNLLLSKAKRAFLFVDCEGGELDLLCNNIGQELDAVDILVECHDFLDRTITPRLYERFSNTHDIELVSEQCRDFRAFPFLEKLGGLQRALAVCEFRPEVMHWLLCTSRVNRKTVEPYSISQPNPGASPPQHQ